MGPPFYALTFNPLMVMALLIVPIGPLLAWKRGDLRAAARRLWIAAALAAACGAVALAVMQPRQALSCAGLALGFWLVFGAAAELAERSRAGRVPAMESLRRLGGPPADKFEG